MMKRLTTALAITIGFYSAVNAQEVSSDHTYSLEECISYALKNNEELKNASLDMDISDQVVKETLADGLPQINGHVDLGYNMKVPVQFIPDFISPAVYGVLFDEGVIPPRELGDPAIFPAQFGTKYTGSASVTVTQMLFDGSYFVGLKAAKTYTQLSEKQRVQTEIEVIEKVSKAYYSVLVNQERQELIERNYGRLDSLLRETKILNENGFAEKIDVNRIQVQFNNISVQQKNISSVLEVSKALLKFQMGLKLSDEIILQDRLEDVVFNPVPEDATSNFAYSNRIEVEQLRVNRELNQLDLKNINVRYLPNIDLYGTLGASAGTQTSGNFFDVSQSWIDYSVVGVRMDVPIFDGLRKSHQIQQRKIQEIQLENSDRQLKNSIDLEIRQAVSSYEQALDNMKAQRENMDLAEEVFNVSRIKYQEGVGSSIEVTNADADYKEAQTNYYSALYDALIAKVDLRKAYGILDKE